MQLSMRNKKATHDSACPLYSKAPAKGCYQCELIRERQAARRARGPLESDDLRGER